MFRYILQKNEKVLRGLICSLLHLNPKTIESITIQNPINLAEDISAKDFISLFPDYPEFYATYKLLNVKNHHLYSSKFTLSVIDLNQTTLATDEDKAYGIDYWAKLFKAKTWEELKMLAKDNEYLDAAANSLYEANADWMVRERCIARKLAERRERTLERDIKLLKEENSDLKDRIKELEEQLLQK